MKKNIGSQMALYPMPLTVIWVMDKDKPTWTLVAHVGIIGHDRVLVSLAAPHFYQQYYQKRTKAFNILASIASAHIAQAENSQPMNI